MCFPVEGRDRVSWEALVASGCFYRGNYNEMNGYSVARWFLDVRLPDLITG